VEASGEGKNHFYIARELWGHISPQNCEWKLQKEGRRIKLKLMKSCAGRDMDHWPKLRRL
jgi:hypothetical protein